MRFVFDSGLGSSSRKLYMSLMDDKEVYDTTPSLFTLTSNSGTFCATPIWSPCRHTDIVTAYPFLQEDLYSASQPGLLANSSCELHVWKGLDRDVGIRRTELGKLPPEWICVVFGVGAREVFSLDRSEDI